jgi:FGFR1 oncogene partner
MDDLKNIVIQTLEDEGTLGALRAQLRTRVFKAIEKHADVKTKQSAGF